VVVVEHIDSLNLHNLVVLEVGQVLIQPQEEQEIHLQYHLHKEIMVVLDIQVI
jgi:hypothetical protein